jgi:hypothetical protein
MLRACIPDHPNLPFSSPNGDAVGQQLIALAVQRQGDEVQFFAVPWTRCLIGMRTGDYDLIVGAEADADLFASIAFPLKAGKVDASRRLGVMQYVLVQKVGSSHASVTRDSWTAEQVVVPRDVFAISRRLRSPEVSPKSLKYDVARFVALLCHDRTEFIVLRDVDLSSTLARCTPEPGPQLQAYPIASTDVFLGVRKALIQSRPELGDSIWQELARIRSSSSWPTDMK